MADQPVAYCARCRKKQPIVIEYGAPGRDKATCTICKRVWPVGAPRV